MDLSGHFRCLLDGIFITASWVQELMDELGISGISQVWGEELGYYIWLSRADCSYALRMESCELPAPYPGVAKAIFSIRCFPYADSKIIKTFSPQERALLESDLFDSTNTPRVECLVAIPAGCFVVAALEITLDLGCGAAAFILASLDHMVTRTSAPFDAVTEGSHYGPSGTANGLTLRNIPAWPLAYPLFDKIVSMYAFRFRAHPRLALHRETRGYEFIAEDGAELGYPVDSDASTLRCLTVAFQPHLSRQSIPLTQYLLDEIAGHSCDVLFDDDSSESDQLAPLFFESRASSLLNPLWWALPHR
ncbi:MAG: hypothetical protein ACPL7J_05305 [Desulfomonilaceae bacterium]